jgi:hypothetical protein
VGADPVESAPTFGKPAIILWSLVSQSSITGDAWANGYDLKCSRNNSKGGCKKERLRILSGWSPRTSSGNRPRIIDKIIPRNHTIHSCLSCTKHRNFATISYMIDFPVFPIRTRCRAPFGLLQFSEIDKGSSKMTESKIILTLRYQASSQFRVLVSSLTKQ